jgi:tetratricopeptide (TPR) repeat protein
LDKGDVLTDCALGRAFLRSEQLDDANARFEAVQKRSPSTACAPIGIAATQPKDASVRALAELARRAPDVWDRAEALATLARVQLVKGNEKEAKRSADEAVHLAPGLPDGHWAQGLVAARERDLALAKDALAKAVALEPADARIRLARAEALVRSEEGLPEAIAEYQAFLRLAAKSPEEARVKKLLPALKKRARAR